MGIQYKVNGTWVFYSKYSGMGYEEIKQEVNDYGKVIYHRRITQLGRELKAMTNEEYRIIVKLLPSEMLHDEVARRGNLQKRMINDIRTALSIKET